jgi:capsule polysaccharide export protein KpsE/RkpR
MPYFQNFTDLQIYDFLKQSIVIEVDKSGAIYISGITSTDFFPTEEKQSKAKKFASELANLAVKGLDKVIRERSVSSARRSKEYIETQIVDYRVKLDSVERALEVFQKDNNVLAIEEQTKAIVSQAIDVGTQMAKAELEYNLAQIELREKSPKLEFYRDQYELLKNQYQKIQNGGITDKETFNFPLNSVPRLIREYTDVFRQRKI